ncbi:MAG TPA: hypothetical protein VJS66_08330 [Burkholderiales bacterium]|nr:hypothetical protein [Burkholderiales bacterium]
MLRSWIDRVRAALAPKNRIGLAIGRDYIGVAQLTAMDEGWQVQHLAHTKLGERLFSRTPTPQTATSLANAIAPLVGDLKQQYVPVHVSLPDAAMRVTTFELDQLPASFAEQTAFTAFRFSSDDDARHVCASQVLGRDGDKHLLLGAALDEAWHRCIAEALQQAGVVAWSLGASSLRLFNRYYDALAPTSGALVLAASDSWALLLWDTQRRVRYARARWRTSSKDHADIATDIERSILAYVHGHPDNAITHIYVSAGAETAVLGAALDARLREPCTQLSNDAGLRFANPVEQQTSAPLSLAAALER